ncbi:uncharacterized protein BO87DRAFT_447363 [Aspergillus neoniger CBS 115656]|uniref:Uncharacterized protein n=1 Tax=Aspergillus neoniger (strain CBS 115656) TaxID=1448310 RepID=A0A318Y823_ASPNB|nr:hypothetical protein BO87DRAFT_447363 [Aspergillus neoniger CBS 115656]PYH29697.1 hypothetical protein BO87DRAFT_447363 [Aspergillus neoniger CBS 115656]
MSQCNQVPYPYSRLPPFIPYRWGLSGSNRLHYCYHRYREKNRAEAPHFEGRHRVSTFSSLSTGPLYLLFFPSPFLLSLFFPFFSLLPPSSSPSTAPSNSTSTTACPVRFCRTATRLVGSRGIFFPYFFFPPSLLTPSRLIPFFFPKIEHFIPRPLSDERTLNCQPAALKAVGSPEYLVLPSPSPFLPTPSKGAPYSLPVQIHRCDCSSDYLSRRLRSPICRPSGFRGCCTLGFSFMNGSHWYHRASCKTPVAFSPPLPPSRPRARY